MGTRLGRCLVVMRGRFRCTEWPLPRRAIARRVLRCVLGKDSGCRGYAVKLAALNSIKFKKLKRRLCLAHWQTVGLLESIWLFTQGNAIAGDIGKHSDEDIAAAIEWEGDATELINTLVECKLLDPCPVHRLLVHGWDKHAPTWVKGVITRHHKGLSEPTKEPTSETTKEPTKQATSEATTFSSLTSSSLTSSSLTLPCVALPSAEAADDAHTQTENGPPKKRPEPLADAIRLVKEKKRGRQ